MKKYYYYYYNCVKSCYTFIMSIFSNFGLIYDLALFYLKIVFQNIFNGEMKPSPGYLPLVYIIYRFQNIFTVPSILT